MILFTRKDKNLNAGKYSGAGKTRRVSPENKKGWGDKRKVKREKCLVLKCWKDQENVVKNGLYFALHLPDNSLSLSASCSSPQKVSLSLSLFLSVCICVCIRSWDWPDQKFSKLTTSNVFWEFNYEYEPHQEYYYYYIHFLYLSVSSSTSGILVILLPKGPPFFLLWVEIYGRGSNILLQGPNPNVRLKA